MICENLFKVYVIRVIFLCYLLTRKTKNLVGHSSRKLPILAGKRRSKRQGRGQLKEQEEAFMMCRRDRNKRGRLKLR